MISAKWSILGLLCISIVGCALHGGNPMNELARENSEGFEAFDTPRTFHGPGTILRRSSNGTVYLVGKIDNIIITGEETFPEIRRTKSMKIGSLMKTIGIGQLPVGFSLQADNAVEVEISAFNGKREMIDDGYLLKLDGFFRDRPKVSGSEYFIIRETISSLEIQIKSSESQLIDWGANIGTAVAESSGSIALEGDSAVIFSNTYDSPRKILYKPERLTFIEKRTPSVQTRGVSPRGAEPSQLKVTAKKVTRGEFLIPEKVISDKTADR
uniref:Uncharacterized protein n=1 Tax=Candidatus Kentrum sp. FW TaxID=2126338 RepID=A0A450RXM0_9GAMM|nr:MAG: hypothetical protein BECKFW1821A_GA0114235_100558 [Candidatus Kentron sp. FW]